MVTAPQAMSGKDLEILKKYLGVKTILIADTSGVSRSGLHGVFTKLGAKPNQMILVKSLNQALEVIETRKPHIFVAEFDLGKRCGLDLFIRAREKFPQQAKESIYIIVTNNTSQSSVARAAEEDVDAFIIKPFTPETVGRTIMSAALAKIKPSEYMLAIEAGKKALAAGDFPNAITEFERAMKLDPQPSLACYYLGQTKFVQQLLDEASTLYESGLQYNRIHYKCMVGLYEIFMARKMHAAAYEIVKRISQYFPANPKRLAEVLRLAIVNAKYEDIEGFYKVFINLDERNDMLIKYVCAALIVCGKYYLGAGRSRTRALQLFQNAAATGSGRTKILKEIVFGLVDHNLAKEADGFLGKFPAETHKSEDYLVARFLVIDAGGVRSKTIEEGRALLANNILDPRVYAVMIRRSLEAQLQPAAETLCRDAIAKYPNLRADFEAILSPKE
jgi:CheY-like chemotaxis protein